MPALDGIEFTVGGDYLVAVLDGQVLTCGISAPYLSLIHISEPTRPY